MKRTYKYKAKINKETESNALQWLSLCQNLYNSVLEQRRIMYRQHRKSLTCYDQIKQLPEMKKEILEYKQVGSQVLQDVVERVDKAFKAFFRRLKTTDKAGFPRFRSFHRYDSFILKQAGWKLEGRNLYIKNVGRFKLFLSRPIEGNIKTVTIRKTPTNDWYVCFSCDNVPVRYFPETDKEVALDVGIKSFLVDSDFNFVENPRFFRDSEKLLRRKQRKLARAKKGSNRRNKTRLQVAKTHLKIRNQRIDFLHKLSNSYIENYKRIYIEDLNIQGLVRRPKPIKGEKGNFLPNKARAKSGLNKSILDTSWYTFFLMLSYKAEEADRIVQKVRPHGTSQICSSCGEKVPKTLKVRIHSCPHCLIKLDRDFNASLNILSAGQAVQGLT